MEHLFNLATRVPRLAVAGKQAKADESAGGSAASATSPRQGPAAAEEASGMQA